MRVAVYPVEPVPAPRQVRRDTWKPSPPVQRYRAFRDALNLYAPTIPEGFHHALFVLPVSASWSEKRKRQMLGMPHTLRPDRDNLEKALLDTVHGEDCHVWDGRTSKLWGTRGLVIVSPVSLRIALPFDLEPFYTAASRARAGQCGVLELSSKASCTGSR